VAALDAFTAAANGPAIFRQPGVNHFVFKATAFTAMHAIVENRGASRGLTQQVVVCQCPIPLIFEGGKYVGIRSEPPFR
jgi:hypothetical protein